MKFYEVCFKKPKRTEWGFLETAATLNTQAYSF